MREWWSRDYLFFRCLLFWWLEKEPSLKKLGEWWCGSWVSYGYSILRRGLRLVWFVARQLLLQVCDFEVHLCLLFAGREDLFSA